MCTKGDYSTTKLLSPASLRRNGAIDIKTRSDATTQSHTIFVLCVRTLVLMANNGLSSGVILL